MAFPNQVSIVPATAGIETGTGLAWTNLANAYDTNLASNASVSPIPASGQTKSLKLNTFDFSWFDNILYDVTGVTLVLKYSADINLTEEVFLIDNSGNDLGSDMGSGLSGGPVKFETIQQTIAIPYTAYSSPNFGVRIKFKDLSGLGGVCRIYHVELILQFARKRTTSNYGLKFRNSSGTEMLSPSGAFVRHIASQDQLGGDVGTFTMPDFDDTKGLFFMAAHLEKFRIDNDTQQVRTYAWTSSQYLYSRGHAMELPNIVWDNVTKTFTMATGGGAYPLPSGFELRGNPKPGFTIVGIHYK